MIIPTRSPFTFRPSSRSNTPGVFRPTLVSALCSLLPRCRKKGRYRLMFRRRHLVCRISHLMCRRRHQGCRRHHLMCRRGYLVCCRCHLMRRRWQSVYRRCRPMCLRYCLMCWTCELMCRRCGRGLCPKPRRSPLAAPWLRSLPRITERDPFVAEAA